MDGAGIADPSLTLKPRLVRDSYQRNSAWQVHETEILQAHVLISIDATRFTYFDLLCTHSEGHQHVLGVARLCMQLSRYVQALVVLVLHSTHERVI